MDVISVLDYGAGNAGSVIRMIELAGGKAKRATTVEHLDNADKLVIPGVGAFDNGMGRLHEARLVAKLDRLAIEQRVPILGICLGMQLMCRTSEEGLLPGLGWFDAVVRRFPDARGTGLPVPHMGWNTLNVSRPCAVLPALDEEQRFYFVHSYCVHCNDATDMVAQCVYGREFVAVIQKNNLFGVQFHPEKSHRFGLALIKRFVELPVA